MTLSDLITKEEWKRLPARCKMIWGAGFLSLKDIKELMDGWRKRWAKEDKERIISNMRI